MSRLFSHQFVVFCLFLLLPLHHRVHCKTSDNNNNNNDNTGNNSKNVVRTGRTDTSASDKLIVSVINGVMKFKDTDFFRSNIEASVRSVFSKPLTSAVYAMSVLAGVVAMLAFYESPVSPMPVPSLPDPPVGRFPPEHPIWPPPQQQQQQHHYQREPIASDKKRVGQGFASIVPQYSMPNIGVSSNVMFPTNQQKFGDIDTAGAPNTGTYQQIVNMLENRNSKVSPPTVKQNRISQHSVSDLTPQVYSSFTVDSDQTKVLNDSVKLQSLYAEMGGNGAAVDDRYDAAASATADIINKFYNQNTFDKIKEFTGGLRKVATGSESSSAAAKDKEKVANSDSNAAKRNKP